MNINDVLNNIDYDEETPEFGEPDVADINEEEREIKKESENKTLEENSNSDIAFEQLKKDENNFAVDSIVPEKVKKLEKPKEIEETEESKNNVPEDIPNTADIRAIEGEENQTENTIKDQEQSGETPRPKVKIIIDDVSSEQEDKREKDKGSDTQVEDITQKEPETTCKEDSEDQEENFNFKLMSFTKKQIERLESNLESNDFLKKMCVSAAAVIIILLIPIIFAVASSKQDININKKVSTTQLSSADPNSKLDTSGFENLLSTKQETPKTEKTDSASNRFETVDDLTLYIQSSTAFYLSTEKQLYTKYRNGVIDGQALKDNIYDCTEKLNSIYHLLIINKAVYEENNISDTYDQLISNINTVFVYGDSILAY